MNRGDIYLCDFGNPLGHGPAFRRPAVVISARELSGFGLPIVLPVTRTKRGYPTHIEVEDALPVPSYVQCEQIRVVASERLPHRVGALDPVSLLKVEAVLRRILVLWACACRAGNTVKDPAGYSKQDLSQCRRRPLRPRRRAGRPRPRAPG